jgi:hypothetical protein
MTWRLARTDAHLDCGDMAANVDLTRFGDGLRPTTVRRNPITEWRLFQHSMPTSQHRGEMVLTESYVRDTDLVASYERSPDSPLSCQVYWRALSGEATGLGGVEVWFSAQTSLLDTDPQLTSTSQLPAGAAYRLVESDSIGLVPLNPDDGNETVLTPDAAPGAVLFRPADAHWSYCEMVHPTDFTSTILKRRDDELQLSSPLFVQEHLEKGVIRRARLRGLFLPRHDDVRGLVDSYRAFAASELPLTA